MPQVSIVVATYNEEKNIDKKIENILSIDYPRDKLEIVVVDSSEDKTSEKVMKWANSISIIKLIKEPKRRGLATALNLGYATAKGKIVVKSDCDILHPPDALKKLIAPFSDLRIGAVSGRQVLYNSSHPFSRIEEGYRSLKNNICELHSKLDSTYMFEPFCAFIKELIEPISVNSVADDGEVALNIRKKGFRTVFVRDALFYEKIPSSRIIRLRQKSRRGQGHTQLVLNNWDILFNKKYGYFGLVIFPTMFFLMLVNPWLLLILGITTSYFLYTIMGVLGLLLIMLILSLSGLSYMTGYPMFLSGFIESQISLILSGLVLITSGPSYIWKKTN
jgi:cellulose synthase/poly-beta-1,6-N-acetylglucosamine synthase-like glycosyltransferase